MGQPLDQFALILPRGAGLNDIMLMAIESRRDAQAPGGKTPRGVDLTMQLQLSTPPRFGDPRLPQRFWSKIRVGDAEAVRRGDGADETPAE